MVRVRTSGWLLLLLLLVIVVACDHKPAPRVEPSQKPAATPTLDAASAAPAGDDVCLQIGVKIAEIIISATTDPTQKAAYELERTKLVKRFSENCTNERWPDATRRCFLAAKTPQEIEVCSRDLVKAQPPTPPTPTPGSAGSGSAAAGSAGSAAAGSGSAATGSTGSGSGSAAPGVR